MGRGAVGSWLDSGLVKINISLLGIASRLSFSSQKRHYLFCFRCLRVVHPDCADTPAVYMCGQTGCLSEQQSDLMRRILFNWFYMKTKSLMREGKIEDQHRLHTNIVQCLDRV